MYKARRKHSSFRLEKGNSMRCKNCNQEINQASVSIDDILAHPDITLDVDYWINREHKKVCRKVTL